MLESVERLLREGMSLEWGIELQGTAKLIGTCGLHSFDATLSSAEVGCMLARDCWNRGYMMETLLEVIRFAKHDLALQQLCADIDSSNERCIRLFEALHFRHVRGTHYVRGLDF